jgi:DNA-binding response OmpR family regulator
VICDDEVHILRASEIKLKSRGYDVASAFDGQSAWELIEAHPPAIVVTDCQMPRMSGLDLARRIRERDRTRNIPIIMLTGKSHELPKDDLKRQGLIQLVMEKPFSPRALLAAVESLLAGTHSMDCPLPETVS